MKLHSSPGACSSAVVTATSQDPGALVLVSHALCSYVQRAAIVLDEKGVPFERREVDLLAAKPEWFRVVSPLGKTPVLLVRGTPIFESAVICEFLDETFAPPLHPADTLERARHRAWIEFGSQVLNVIAGLYNAADAAQLEAKRIDLTRLFAQLEAVLGGGPYFAGTGFSIVDAAFAPVFRYFDTFDRITDLGAMRRAPKLRDWRAALAQRPSVRRAVGEQYPGRLLAFLRSRGSELSRLADHAMA